MPRKEEIMSDFHVEVETTDELRAGTGANIFLVLFGEFGQAEEIRLNGFISGNAFERNRTAPARARGRVLVVATVTEEDVNRLAHAGLPGPCWMPRQPSVTHNLERGYVAVPRGILASKRKGSGRSPSATPVLSGVARDAKADRLALDER
jgi:hypothetical protein